MNSFCTHHHDRDVYVFNILFTFRYKLFQQHNYLYMPVDIAFVILQENLCVNMLQGILFGNVYLYLEIIVLDNIHYQHFVSFVKMIQSIKKSLSFITCPRMLLSHQSAMIGKEMEMCSGLKQKVPACVVTLSRVMGTSLDNGPP